MFVLNTVDGCIPSDLGVGTTPEIEEERRLLYVAMTRAKDQLHLMVPQRFFTHGQRGLGDRHVYAQRTRFIPNSLTKHFQSRYWPQAKAAGRAARKARRAGGRESQDARHVGLARQPPSATVVGGDPEHKIVWDVRLGWIVEMRGLPLAHNNFPISDHPPPACSASGIADDAVWVRS